MNGYKYVSSIDGNCCAEVKSKVYFKENKNLDYFKSRIKSWKSYSEDLIIEELYNIIRYSKHLETVIEENNETNFEYYKKMIKLEEELEKIKKSNEKWKAMFTEQAIANAKLVNKEE